MTLGYRILMVFGTALVWAASLGVAHGAPVLNLDIQGGDFAAAMPGSGQCSSDPADFSPFRCVASGASNPVIMGQYQAPSLTEFSYFGLPVVSFTAAGAPGARDNPTGTPVGQVDALGNLTVDLGAWYVNWSGGNYWMGTDPGGLYGDRVATGRCDFDFTDLTHCKFDLRWISATPTAPIPAVTYWHLTGVATVDPIICPAVITSVTIATSQDQTASWVPDPDVFGVCNISPPADAAVLHCSLASLPAHGAASVNADCSGGTYTPAAGYVGTDVFSYRIVDNAGAFGTAPVFVTVTGDPCRQAYPLRAVTLAGGGQGQAVNATLTTTFTGHITADTANALSICPGTTLGYETASSVGTASCLVNGTPVGGSGALRVGDKLVCTNRPAGGDTDRFRILAGP